jgi:hypothetical protein
MPDPPGRSSAGPARDHKLPPESESARQGVRPTPFGGPPPSGPPAWSGPRYGAPGTRHPPADQVGPSFPASGRVAVGGHCRDGRRAGLLVVASLPLAGLRATVSSIAAMPAENPGRADADAAAAGFAPASSRRPRWPCIPDPGAGQLRPGRSDPHRTVHRVRVRGRRRRAYRRARRPIAARTRPRVARRAEKRPPGHRHTRPPDDSVRQR